MSAVTATDSLNSGFCIACLRAGEDVFIMNNSILKSYQKLISKVPIASTMQICMYCRQIFTKLIKFIHRCKQVHNYLSESGGNLLSDNTKPSLKYSNNLQLSEITTHSLGSNEIDETPAEIQVNEEISFFDDFDINSDDEVPLSVLSKNNIDKEGESITNSEKGRVKVKEKKKSYKAEQSENGMETSQRRRKWTTAKGAEKEGFTSKMVQETQEYLVIKLTKEQVIQEMEERSKSENYLKYTYKCDKCVKGFNFEDVLQNHLQKHLQKSGSFECDICHQFCPSAVSLRGHVKSHTTRYKCKVCSQVRLSRQHLLEHHAISHGGGASTYTCEQCQYTTDKRTVIQRHVRSHTRDRRACHRCGKSFSTLLALRVHLQAHENRSKSACDQCSRKFRTKTLLQRHITAVHERSDYYCVECDVKFQCAYNLNLHYKRARRHRDDSSYKYACGTCPQKFVYASGAASHAITHNNVNKQTEPFLPTAMENATEV